MFRVLSLVLILPLAIACSSPAVEWEEKQIDNDDIGIILKSVEYGPVAALCADMVTEPQLRVRLERPVAPSNTPSGEPELRVVDVTATVDGQEMPLEWTTWSSANVLTRVRENDAITLTQAMFSTGTESFHLEFHKFPELSQEFQAPDLERALKDADMECFG